MRYEKDNHNNPEIRRYFNSLEEICRLINRGKSYVSIRLCGHKEFSELEKEIINNRMKELMT